MIGKAAKANDTRATLLHLWSYLKKQRLALILAAILVVITSGLNLVGPYLLGVAFDRYIVPRDLPGLARLALLMLGVYALTSVLTWWQSYIMVEAAQKTVREIRKDLFEALQGMPLRFFDTRAHGDLMSRLTNDVENVNQVLTDSVASIASGLIGLVGSAIAMFVINPTMAAVSLPLITLLTLVLNRWLAARTREGFRAQQSALGLLNGLIEETIGGQRVVKAHRREPTVLAQFGTSNTTLRTAATRAQIFAGFIGPLMNGVNNLSLALVAGLGGALAVSGLASVGTIASFISYARQFGRPITDIANLYSTIQSAVAGAERVFEIMAETPERDAPDAKPLVQIEGDVVFEGVDFGYVPGKPVLRDVSLHARPGEMVALIGPTGAGKTTIINLLTRFYDVDAGRILVDGHDIRDLRKDDLRRQLGIVLQDTYLFSGSVQDNIRYGWLEASDDEVIAAARLANADGFIHRLPQGYQTPLSERASNLSQGQRQLIAIARAILADPRILILDEATSSVDTRTEQHIQEAMRRLMAGRTSFVIAHRLSTIRQADQILVIQAGEVTEQGTHEALMAQRGFYHRLSTNQFGEADEEMVASG